MVDQTNNLSIHETMEIAAPVHEVWTALIVPEVRMGWWGYLDLEPTVGGRVEETWAGPDGNPMRTRGVVTAMVDAELLCLRWADEGWHDSTDVEFRLHDADHGTVVHLRENGLDRLPDGGQIAEEHRAGWRVHLSNLRRCVEGRARR